MSFSDASLTPLVATSVFVLAVLSGYGFRRTWKAEGPVARLWAYGALAAVCFLTLAFVPVRGG